MQAPYIVIPGGNATTPNTVGVPMTADGTSTVTPPASGTVRPSPMFPRKMFALKPSACYSKTWMDKGHIPCNRNESVGVAKMYSESEADCM